MSGLRHCLALQSKYHVPISNSFRNRAKNVFSLTENGYGHGSFGKKKCASCTPCTIFLPSFKPVPIILTITDDQRQFHEKRVFGRP